MAFSKSNDTIALDYLRLRLDYQVTGIANSETFPLLNNDILGTLGTSQ